MQRVAVAVSGGRDSTALLHCTLRAARPLGVAVMALHVHHGLMPAAGEWQARVQAQARRWGAGFAAQRLATGPGAGDSIEAWARRERYRALAEMAQQAGCDLVLLAHHRQDQAETWLLQALRGGGAAGLSAMPRMAVRGGILWARPWLNLPRAAIDAYMRRHRLSHVEDDSNSDPRHARNRLRLTVWPALTGAFADAEVALAGAAQQAQAAAALAAEVAAHDLPPLQRGPALAQAAWLALPPARRRNALQAWLMQGLAGPLPHRLVDRLVAELPVARAGRWPVPDGELRLYRGLLTVSAGVSADAGPVKPAPAATLDLSRPGQFAMPAWRGHFSVAAVAQGGADSRLLTALHAQARTGGERFRLTAQGLPRSLKKQYQARAIAAWHRSGPLLYTPDGRLMFAPGLGIDAGLQAGAGEPQLCISWQPDPAR